MESYERLATHHSINPSERNLTEIRLQCFKGIDVLKYCSDLATLRISVFREYPYLYAGSMEYETDYLKTYLECPESFMVIVFDGELVVGASTAIPLEFEMSEFQKPFLENGYTLRDIFYFGESILLPEYRGRKLYRHFFTEREAAARNYGSKITAFCAVDRLDNDSNRPKEYQALDPIWNNFGYTKYPKLKAYFEWQEISEDKPSLKPMTFWLKFL